MDHDYMNNKKKNSKIVYQNDKNKVFPLPRKSENIDKKKKLAP